MSLLLIAYVKRGLLRGPEKTSLRGRRVSLRNVVPGGCDAARGKELSTIFLCTVVESRRGASRKSRDIRPPPTIRYTEFHFDSRDPLRSRLFNKIFARPPSLSWSDGGRTSGQFVFRVSELRPRSPIERGNFSPRPVDASNGKTKSTAGRGVVRVPAVTGNPGRIREGERNIQRDSAQRHGEPITVTILHFTRPAVWLPTFFSLRATPRSPLRAL